MLSDRKFLTVADDTKECVPAIMFAAMRAKTVGAGLVIMRVARLPSMGHWRGLDEELRTEVRDNALSDAQSLARRVKERVGIEAEVEVSIEKPVQAIRDIVDKDSAIKVLVLGSGGEKAGPGPLVSRVAKGKPLANRPIAITIIPGDLSDLQLDEMGGMDH